MIITIPEITINIGFIVKIFLTGSCVAILMSTLFYWNMVVHELKRSQTVLSFKSCVKSFFNRYSYRPLLKSFVFSWLGVVSLAFEFHDYLTNRD